MLAARPDRGNRPKSHVHNNPSERVAARFCLSKPKNRAERNGTDQSGAEQSSAQHTAEPTAQNKGENDSGRGPDAGRTIPTPHSPPSGRRRRRCPGPSTSRGCGRPTRGAAATAAAAGAAAAAAGKD
eukprot:gene20005-biopygen19083